MKCQHQNCNKEASVKAYRIPSHAKYHPNWEIYFCKSHFELAKELHSWRKAIAYQLKAEKGEKAHGM